MMLMRRRLGCRSREMEMRIDFDEQDSLCPVLQGLGVPFSPVARGSRELSPLIPLLWTIDTTLLPVLLFDLSSSI
uniref:Uncharacterized protein n=1 Tax=Brassica campestris TaxID=3711 RepID=M4FBG3_BRACM